MNLPVMRTIPFLHRNGLARTDSVLAYAQRTASPAGEAMLT